MRSVVRQVWLATAAAVVGLGCSGDANPINGTPPPNVSGVYQLQTINGQALPFLIDQVDEDKLEITAGTVTLSSSGTFTDVTTFRLTIGGQVTTETDSASGVWSISGNTVTLSPAGFPAYTMTWDGANTLTQQVEGFTFVYVR